jgi:transmembrane sensor
MSYSSYSVEDFIADEEFIKWVKNPDEQSNTFWNSWLTKNPHKQSDVARAREIILLLDIKSIEPQEGKFLETWEKILERTEENSDHLMVTPHDSELATVKQPLTWFYKVAAAIAMLLVAFAGYTAFQTFNKTTIRTSYGESRTLFLPDSTKVTLNANSSISFNKTKFESNREVWLEGEAFFAVVHKLNNANFGVHTNELELEVLGTRFDVNSRRGTTKVILEEGKVRLDMNRSRLSDIIIMKPGDLVEVSKEAQSLSTKSVDPLEYISWRNNLLEFNAMPISEIANMIEDNYGYKVLVLDEQIGEKKFTGSASADNLEDLTEKLSKIFNLKITQENNEIRIENQ